MATAVKSEAASTSIATVVAQTPAVVLVDDQKREELYAHIQREVEAFEPDLSTQKGRDAIKSLAFKITRTKTAIDAAGKQLNEDARAKINAVDAARRDAREKLDAMAKAVRQPLTDWEEAEEKRIEWCNQVIADFKRGSLVTMDDTAETVRARGKAAWDVILSEETFGDMLPEAQAAKDACCATLKAALDRLVKEEADRAELERLRAEKEEREAREQAEREERERAEREAAEAREAEERRIAAEQAEAERIERARQEAADAARREAEQAAQREREEAERAKQAELDAANERARIAEAARQKVEHQREWSQKIIQHCRAAASGFIDGQPQSFGILERELETKVTATTEEFGDFAPDVERARVECLAQLREIKRQGDERRDQEARDADRAHRGKVMGAAKSAMMTCGADEETAKKIVLAIIAGEIPHITLRF